MEYEMMVNGFKVKAYYHKDDIDYVFKPLLKRWESIQKEKKERIFIFLAAPPGCGKTTLSLFLQQLSKEEGCKEIQAIGMDGFHYTNEYLKNHFMEEDGSIICLKQRKGSYHTFDYKALLSKVIEGKHKDNKWPVYSRELHDPIKEQIQLKADIILVEGNYLLLKEKGWEDLIHYCDDSVFVYSDELSLKDRLISRKQKGGLSYEDAYAFYINSDRKNVLHVLNHSHDANIVLELKDHRYKRKKPL